jgi:hypothetical protein
MRWWAWCYSTAPTRTSGCALRRSSSRAVVRVRSAHGHQPGVARRVPGSRAVVYLSVGGRRHHRSGTPGESERAAAPNAARRSGPRHPLCRAVSGLAKRQDGRNHDRAAGGSRQARPQRALRHRYQERAQHPPGPAGAGHSGDPGGGRGGAQPKHLDPSTVIPGAHVDTRAGHCRLMT